MPPADVAGLAFDLLTEDDRLQAPRAGGRGGGGHGVVRRGQHDRRRPRQPGVARLGRLRRCAAPVGGAGAQVPGGRRWRRDAILAEDTQRLSVCRGVADRRPRRDHRRIVARNVGDDQRDHRRRRRGHGQAAALDRRKMLAHAVHLGDRRAATQQRRPDLALVVGTNALGRKRQQRRPAPRDQAQYQIVGGESCDQRHDARRRRPAGFIGHRMSRLDDLDALAGHTVAVRCDHETGQRPAPGPLHGARHGRGGLPRSYDDRAAQRRLRQPARHHRLGRSGSYGGLEQGEQAGPGRISGVRPKSGALSRRSSPPQRQSSAPGRRAGPARRH